MDKVWISIFIATTIFISIDMGSVEISSEHPEVDDWPSVFVLEPHPTHPVICFSGKSQNIIENNDDEIIFLEEVGMNVTTSSIRQTKKFILSSDPKYPAMCQEVHVPSNLMNNGTAEDNTTVSNITCIRRDYEQNISAIFINKVGPIKSALNVFNSSIPYGVNNVENLESIGEIRILNETVVDCEDYGITTDDKGLTPGTAASLAGLG